MIFSLLSFNQHAFFAFRVICPTNSFCRSLPDEFFKSIDFTVIALLKTLNNCLKIKFKLLNYAFNSCFPLFFSAIEEDMCHSSDKSNVGGSCWGTPPSWGCVRRGGGTLKIHCVPDTFLSFCLKD